MSHLGRGRRQESQLHAAHPLCVSALWVAALLQALLLRQTLQFQQVAATGALKEVAWAEAKEVLWAGRAVGR